MLTAIVERFKPFLRRAFDIREGELERAALMQLNIFLIISALLIVKPTVNGLFLAHFGAEQLPLAFILVAISAALFSYLYSGWLSRAYLNKVIIQTNVISIIILVSFGLLLRLNFLEGWVLYLFYVWVAIFAVLSASQFWILANVVFNAREAKRLFGFIGTGAIAGGIFGGYLTSALASWFSSEYLLFVSAFLIYLNIPITRRIWKNYVLATQTFFQRRKRIKGLGEHPLKLIRQSRHLTFLAVIVGISVLVARLVDYQFSAIASYRIDDPDQLTAFFGFWFSTFNVISLGIQLFLTRRVVGVFGVGTSLMVLPAGIAIGALVILFFPELWAAILIKMFDGSLKQSLNKSSIELLALPIPSDIKNQAKSYIDVFVDSAATGLGGLFLIFLVSGLNLSTGMISLLIIALLGLWFYFAFLIRKEYIQSFLVKLKQNDPGKSRKEFDLSDESVVGGLRKVLEAGSDKQILWALKKIREHLEFRLLDGITPLLGHASPEIRAEAVRCLYFYSREDFTEEVRPLAREQDPQVRTEALQYLISRAGMEEQSSFNIYLDSPDLDLTESAYIAVAMESRDNVKLRELFRLENRVMRLHKDMDRVEDPSLQARYKVCILRTTGLGGLTACYPMITVMLEDSDPHIVEQALVAAGNTLAPEFIKPLTRFLMVAGHRETARKALGNYGKEIIGELEEMLEDPATEIELVRQFPGVVDEIGSQRSIEFLFSLLEYEDHTVRLEVLRSLNQLKVQFPFLVINKKSIVRQINSEAKLYTDTLSVLYLQTKIMRDNPEDDERFGKRVEARESLAKILERRLDGSLERIFRLLGLRYPTQDILEIYKGIHSSKTDLRESAVEFLDNLLDPNLKRVLIPIVESAVTETLSDDVIRNLKVKVPGERQCFEMLLGSKDPKLKIAVLYLIGQLNDSSYLPIAEKMISNPHPKVSYHARLAVDSMRTTSG